MLKFAIRVLLPALLSVLMCGWIGCAHRNAATRQPTTLQYPQTGNQKIQGKKYPYLFAPRHSQQYSQSQSQSQPVAQNPQGQYAPNTPMNVRPMVLQENVPQDAQPYYFQQYSPQQYAPQQQSSPQKSSVPYLFHSSRRTSSPIEQVSANVPYGNHGQIALAGNVPDGSQNLDEFFEQSFSGNEGDDFLDNLQFPFLHPPQRNVAPNQQIVRENMVPHNAVPQGSVIPNTPYANQVGSHVPQNYFQNYSQNSNAGQYPWDQYPSPQESWNPQPSWIQQFLEKLPWSRQNREQRYVQQSQGQQSQGGTQQSLPAPYQRFLLTNNGLGETMQKLRPSTAVENVTHSKFANAVSYEYRPLTNRNWIPNHARQATADVGEEYVSIQNVRNTSYQTATNYKTSYFDATYALSDLQSLYLVEVPFKGMPSVAHVEISFGFADGKYLGVSVEARYERGESYDPLGGLFNQFELIYVIANEQDMIRINTDINQNDVYLYRLDLTQEEIRAIFVDVMHRANKLSQEPEFYHTISNNCTSNIIDHINRVRPKAIPSEYRAVFPGYLDHLLFDLKLLDVKETNFANVRKNAKINDLAQKFHQSEFFSAGIRQNFY